ncbi:MAG: ferritin [Peptoniphilaceae bacterium]|nr:ferritin [Peptoniphilaceae bacterium]MDY6019451.1 ferritin [Anaerococcus sp.]
MSKKVLEMINEQMNFELESAYIYKAMEVFVDDLQLDGFTSWLKIQSDEELAHAEGMKLFLQSVGYKPVYKAIPQPEGQYEDILDVMKKAYEHEKLVSSKIREIAKVAREEDEERAISFIQFYINEQVEEEENFSKVVTRLERIINDWPSIYVMDAEMGQRSKVVSVPGSQNN